MVPGNEDLSIPEADPLLFQKSLLTGWMWRSELATDTDHSPPRDRGVGAAEDRAHGSGCPGKPRLGGHVTVGDHITRLERAEDLEHCILERTHSVPKRRSPMSPRPGRM